MKAVLWILKGRMLGHVNDLARAGQEVAETVGCVTWSRRMCIELQIRLKGADS